MSYLFGNPLCTDCLHNPNKALLNYNRLPDLDVMAVNRIFGTLSA